MTTRIILLLLISLLLACKESSEPKIILNDQEKFLNIVMGFDTLSIPNRIVISDSITTVLKSQNDTLSPYYQYLTAYSKMFNESFSHASGDFQKLQLNEKNEWGILASYHLLFQDMQTSVTLGSDKFDQIYNLLAKAEKANSRFTYRCYDLLAKGYFNNREHEKTKKFTDLYFQNHPFKDNNLIKIRYFDISFLIADRLGDQTLMQQYLDSSKALSVYLKDSTQIIRTYQYEALLQLAKQNNDAAIAAELKIFDYYKRNDLLIGNMFNNLAKTYLNTGQYNNALKYYKQGIEWNRTNNQKSSELHLYNGVRLSYAGMQDYKNAFLYLDTLLNLKIKDIEQSNQQQIDELHVKYETDKKEATINNLELNNATDQKIINQQRWIVIGAILLSILMIAFFYIIYNRKILNAKNKQLASENKKLQIEQKLKQSQLDPHFIYNSIANLQGLIFKGEKEKANNYLLAFSKLMRNILELNRFDEISLAEEISAIQNYLQLQQMRYEDRFEFTINDNDLETDQIAIPPMLLQPFIENAIEHGFSNISYKGHLSLIFETQNQQLQITILDNGKGVSSHTNSQKQSLSSTIIKERLDILFNNKIEQAGFTIVNLSKVHGQGYKVVLYLPLEYLV